MVGSLWRFILSELRFRAPLDQTAFRVVSRPEDWRRAHLQSLC